MQGGSGIAENAMQQLGIRIALKCSEEDAAIVLGKSKDAIRLVLPNDAGSAIIVPHFAQSQEFKQMKVGNLERADQVKLLSLVEAEYQKRGVSSGPRARTTKVLVSRIEDTRGNPFQDFVVDGRMTSHPLTLHPGEPLDASPSFTVQVSGKAGDNLIVAGENLGKLGSLTYFALLDLAIARLRLRKAGAPGDVDVVFFDTGAGAPDSPVRNLATRCAPTLIDRVTPADALAALARVHATLGNRPPKTATWLVIANLNFMDMFAAGAYASSMQGFTMLTDILRDGPAQQIYTLACTDDLAVWNGLYPGLLASFGRRVGFDLTDDQARDFLRVDPTAIRGDAAALWTSGGGSVLFRPFLQPELPWQKRLFDRFKAMV
jgi:hypothetical protein